MMVVKSTNVGKRDALFQAAQHRDDLARVAPHWRRRAAQNG
jgi:hypothetical protein